MYIDNSFLNSPKRLLKQLRHLPTEPAAAAPWPQQLPSLQTTLLRSKC